MANPLQIELSLTQRHLVILSPEPTHQNTCDKENCPRMGHGISNQLSFEPTKLRPLVSQNLVLKREYLGLTISIASKRHSELLHHLIGNIRYRQQTNGRYLESAWETNARRRPQKHSMESMKEEPGEQSMTVMCKEARIHHLATRPQHSVCPPISYTSVLQPPIMNFPDASLNPEDSIIMANDRGPNSHPSNSFPSQIIT
jgi:hypothetical protein